jgi:hypothetical protein
LLPILSRIFRIKFGILPKLFGVEAGQNPLWFTFV